MKRVLIGVAVAVILIGGLVAAVVLRPLEPAPSQMSSPVTETPAQSDAEAHQPGRYAAYDESLVAAAGYDETILFFHASWCPECRAFEQAIESSMIPDGVQILKVNYDTASELKQQHAVTLQSTFVKVTSSGEQISKWVGYGKDKSVDAIRENT